MPSTARLPGTSDPHRIIHTDKPASYSVEPSRNFTATDVVTAICTCGHVSKGYLGGPGPSALSRHAAHVHGANRRAAL